MIEDKFFLKTVSKSFCNFFYGERLQSAMGCNLLSYQVCISWESKQPKFSLKKCEQAPSFNHEQHWLNTWSVPKIDQQHWKKTWVHTIKSESFIKVHTHNRIRKFLDTKRGNKKLILTMSNASGKIRENNKNQKSKNEYLLTISNISLKSVHHLSSSSWSKWIWLTFFLLDVCAWKNLLLASPYLIQKILDRCFQ